MTVWLGAYVGDNSTVNAEQQQWVLDALQIYGTDHVSGVTIGNECALFPGMGCSCSRWSSRLTVVHVAPAGTS